jgi:hypothetical protein
MSARVRRGLLERGVPPDGAMPLLPWVNCLVRWVARARPDVELRFGARWAHAVIPAMPQRIRGWMIKLMMHVPATHRQRPRPDDAPLALVADLAVATAWAAFKAITDW